ncbi:MAG TPA: NAD(+)/NADH kinase [Candidatus Dormibacteraeota bacterium]|nr:NAD(+)/NADH kinase [Candidatus Dormibacteraeota bacterium]
MIRNVGIISRPRREDVAAVVPSLIEWLTERKLNVFSDEETAEFISTGRRQRTRTELAAEVDFLIVLGGDGTLLSAARAAAERRVPILPVNLGGLGFLTSITREELYPLLDLVLAGHHHVSNRVMLQADIARGGSTIETHRALNDAVLNKGALARMIDLDLHIDGDFVSKYKADGLIVSTPTGSTAYSLSAAGPIIHPLVAAFVITPICPHTLSDRPLVVPDTSKIETGCLGDIQAALTIDGQIGIELQPGDRVRISKAAETISLVRAPSKTYYEVLRSKLGWGER